EDDHRRVVPHADLAQPLGYRCGADHHYPGLVESRPARTDGIAPRLLTASPDTAESSGFAISSDVLSFDSSGEPVSHHTGQARECPGVPSSPIYGSVPLRLSPALGLPRSSSSSQTSAQSGFRHSRVSVRRRMTRYQP